MTERTPERSEVLDREKHDSTRGLRSDNPIQRSEDDSLGRLESASIFAKNILSLDASEVVVVGVLGAWGSGKTSFINLAREEFKRNGVPVLDFNPWMFSGTEQLVESFFSEISAQLNVASGLEEVGKKFSEYGEIFSGLSWLPFVGPWVERGQDMAKILGDLLQRKREGISGIRGRVVDALLKLDLPIVVVLDDIDRLSTDEIRDLFKLVRLTANFPNIVYIVSFDRSRVENALSEQGLSGRAYLEKIIQVGIDLPAIPFGVLNSQIFSALNDALSSIDSPAELDQSVWTDVFMEIIRPLILNMRDVRRYSLAVSATIRNLNGQISMADLLALEAIKVFLPDVFQQIHSSVDELTSVTGTDYGERKASERMKKKIDRLIEIAGEKSEVVKSLVDRLFPAARRHIGGSIYGPEWKSDWLLHRRVAHENILKLYLERVVGDDLRSFMCAEEAWRLMSSRQLLDEYLRSVDPLNLQDVIASLEIYESKFSPDQVVPSSIVLLNLLPSLTPRPRGMFALDTSMVVGRVVYRLIRSLKVQVELEKSVGEIYSSLSLLSLKLQLIMMVGYRDGVGHKLVSEAFAKDIEMKWRYEVENSPADILSAETDLLRVYLIAQEGQSSGPPSPAIPDYPGVTLALLRSARSDATSQTYGTRVVKRFPRLAWEAVIKVYGDASLIKQRLSALMLVKPEGEDDLLALAQKYSSGWKPADDEA